MEKGVYSVFAGGELLLPEEKAEAWSARELKDALKAVLVSWACEKDGEFRDLIVDLTTKQK
jgi:hypothetical protein